MHDQFKFVILSLLHRWITLDKIKFSTVKLLSIIFLQVTFT